MQTLLVHISTLSIARYSCIQRVKKLVQGFNTAAQDSNPGPLNQESEVLPLAIALYKCTQFVIHTLTTAPFIQLNWSIMERNVGRSRLTCSNCVALVTSTENARLLRFSCMIVKSLFATGCVHSAALSW